MYDSHIHSDMSFDSKMKGHDACEVALNNSLQGITFTEHLDYDFPDDDYVDPHMGRYNKMIEDLQVAYPNIYIGKGIEMGYQSHVLHKNIDFLTRNSFDFIINSVHVLEGLDLYDAYYDGREKEEAYVSYLEKIQESVVKFKDYDVVAHIGYICRYSPYQDFTMRYLDYSDLLDAILTQVVQDGKGLDVNTSGYRMGYRRNLGTSLPSLDILSRYKQLGGEIITLGSDAHNKKDIGSHFKECVQYLKHLGFDKAYFYKDRTPVPYRI